MTFSMLDDCAGLAVLSGVPKPAASSKIFRVEDKEDDYVNGGRIYQGSLQYPLATAERMARNSSKWRDGVVCWVTRGKHALCQ